MMNLKDEQGKTYGKMDVGSGTLSIDTTNKSGAQLLDEIQEAYDNSASKIISSVEKEQE